MRILHVWNTAAVPSTLSKYLRKKGIHSDVITRKVFDKYDFGDVYSDFTKNYDVSSKDFYLLTLKKAEDYDILHVHAVDKLVPILKIYHRKPVFLHYHGNDIRGRGNSLFKKLYRKFSDLLFISTLDLFNDLPTANYLPNPIDTDFFKPINGLKRDNTALYFLKKPDDRDTLKIIKKIAEDKGLELQIFNRVEGEILPYSKLPKIYNSYEYFIDRIKIKSLSKMALEALACGLKVIKDDQIISNLPKPHHPYCVIENLLKLYKKFFF